MTTHYVPNGEHIFTVISRYDDVLADIVKKAGYKAGDTLKLILPFLKAFGVTDRKMRSFSAKTLLLISNIKESLKLIQKAAYAFVVSTSYEHYIKALCQALNFPFRNVYCTKVKIDKYLISQKEQNKIRGLAAEIAKMPIIEIPKGACSIGDFPIMHQQVIKRLDEIFWKEVGKMKIGKIFKEVNPVGGREKAEAVKQISKKLNVNLSNVVYVGDSITDVEAFKTVRDGGGLTISFNGNEYAIREAEIAIMSEKALVTALITTVFCKFDKKGVIELVKNWSLQRIKELNIEEELKIRFLEAYKEKLPHVEAVTKANMERLAKKSTAFRKTVRGEAIGRLG